MILGILGGCLVASLLAVAGVANLVASSALRRSQVRSILADDEVSTMLRLSRWDRAFRRTRLGARLQQELVLSGLSQPPLVVFLATAAAGAALAYVLWFALAPVFALAGLLAAFLGARGYLARGKSRRLEAFIAQMPQLARVLANALDAGRSITTAVQIAAAAMDDPAGTEMKRVADRLQVDASVEHALSEVQQRLPSREVAVLISTLIISARSGGSLIASLRDIAMTLEDRKEVRREVRTTLAQALFTGYVVVGMGFGFLFMLNVLKPGTVEKMTTTPVGQLALVMAFALFSAGLVVIRAMTRIEP